MGVSQLDLREWVKNYRERCAQRSFVIAQLNGEKKKKLASVMLSEMIQTE